MRQVEPALTSTADKMVSIATKFSTINATLTRVEESTTKMSGLLETNCTQLQQLRDNETARVAAMQEHHDQLDNMDAVLSRIYNNVMKSVNLAQEVDLKILASRQTASVDNQHPPAPGLISPPRPSETDTTQPPPDDSVPNANTTMGDSPVARLAAPHQFANISLGPEGFIGQRASSHLSGNCPPSFPEGLPRASSRQAHFKHPTDYRFKGSRPTEVDTLQDPMAPTNMGGQVESPRPSNKERQARNRKMSIYDVAGLASTAYHGNHYGVEWLDIPFIHQCGYQTILPAAAKDVLLCYRDIQQRHRKVRQAWTNPHTHILGPLVDRILEKGLPVFPKLLTLTAKETVSFYDKFQELLSGYLLPLMPFDVIWLAFNFKGLFNLGLGTECYADCAAAMMEVLPRLLPPHDLEVQVAISAVCNKSKKWLRSFLAGVGTRGP
jgi:hypothetical protein